MQETLRLILVRVPALAEAAAREETFGRRFFLLIRAASLSPGAVVVGVAQRRSEALGATRTPSTVTVTLETRVLADRRAIPALRVTAVALPRVYLGHFPAVAWVMGALVAPKVLAEMVEMVVVALRYCIISVA